MIKASELLANFPQLIQGKLDSEITCGKISPPDSFDTGDLVFCADKAALEVLGNSKFKAGLIVTNKHSTEQIPQGTPVLFTDNPRLTQALVKQFFQDFDSEDSEWDQIHPSAVIHSSASIGKNCRIGPNVVIGKDVMLGDNTTVRSNSVIEHDTHIGKDCIIHNLVNIGYNSNIGDRVIIYSGAVIGNEGFGFAQDDNKQYNRIPHTGNVEISDDVRIGANCNIDRGTYGATQIKRGTKIDALCHIAHNVIVGEDCAFAAQSGIAGSSVIGDRVILSGHSAIVDHVKVTDDVVLVHRAGVISDISNKGMWAGTPQKPMKEYVKNLKLGTNQEKKIEKLNESINELKLQLEEARSKKTN